MDERGARTDIAENEISLVDILALLLCYRRVLAVFIGLAAVLALAMVLVLPGFLVKKLASEQSVEAIAALSHSQAVDSILDSAMLDEYAAKVFSDPALVLAALRKAEVYYIDGMDIREGVGDTALSFIRRRLLNNQDSQGKKLREDQRLYEASVSLGNLELRFLNTDEQKALAALRELIALANARLSVFVAGLASEEIRNFEHMLSIENPSQGIIETISSAYFRYNAAKLLDEGIEPVYVVVYGPYALRSLVTLEMVRNSVIKKAILGFIGAVFLSLLLVFMLQGIESIKNDKAAMAKINAALEKK
ncbi:MAG TPA: hypothetical protein DCG47_11045 [Spirochaetaceae bacterium]|jgi:hypothetical protein|nr:hypothetical protein [Spirochaetaceae bacterium]